MNIITFIYLEGACITLAAAGLVIVAVAVIFEWWRKARLWDRYTRACGGPESAMQVLIAAEKLDDHLHRGFKAAKRFGWLERFL